MTAISGTCTTKVSHCFYECSHIFPQVLADVHFEPSEQNTNCIFCDIFGEKCQLYTHIYQREGR